MDLHPEPRGRPDPTHTSRDPSAFPWLPPHPISAMPGSAVHLPTSASPFPSLPKDLPPFLSAKPLIWRQRWVCYRFSGHFFFFIAFRAVVLLTLLCLCAFVSLNVGATGSLVLCCVSFWRRKGGLAAGEDLSCYFGNRATVCTTLLEVMFGLFMPFLLNSIINLGSGTVNKFVNNK